MIERLTLSLSPRANATTSEQEHDERVLQSVSWDECPSPTPALRSFIFTFAVLMSIATFCFLGFSYALWTLGGGEYSWSQIGWYLLEVSIILAMERRFETERRYWLRHRSTSVWMPPDFDQRTSSTVSWDLFSWLVTF